MYNNIYNIKIFGRLQWKLVLTSALLGWWTFCQSAAQQDWSSPHTAAYTPGEKVRLIQITRIDQWKHFLTFIELYMKLQSIGHMPFTLRKQLMSELFNIQLTAALSSVNNYMTKCVETAFWPLPLLTREISRWNFASRLVTLL